MLWIICIHVYTIRWESNLHLVNCPLSEQDIFFCWKYVVALNVWEIGLFVSPLNFQKVFLQNMIFLETLLMPVPSYLEFYLDWVVNFYSGLTISVLQNSSFLQNIVYKTKIYLQVLYIFLHSFRAQFLFLFSKTYIYSP